MQKSGAGSVAVLGVTRHWQSVIKDARIEVYLGQTEDIGEYRFKRALSACDSHQRGFGVSGPKTDFETK